MEPMGNVLTESGPAVLVPAAWTTAAAAVAGSIEPRTLLIAHGVMAVLIAAFASVSWSEMSEGVLRAWRAVLVAGFFVTLAGFVGLLEGFPYGTVLPTVSLYGWFLLPAAGFVYTAGEVEVPDPYLAGAALTVAGAAVHAYGVTTGFSPIVGIALVGVGQTVGIADAAYRY
jgi:hypothetical protein